MKRLLFALAVGAAFWTAACGGSGSTIQPPPPTGKYSPASLKGQYAFVTNGEVFVSGAVNATPLARTGVFVANGQGGITGGIEDINTFGTPSNAISITGGSYTVSSDGRGTLTLSFQGGGSVNFGIVLTSTSAGLLIDETSNSSQASTGSGNFVLQQSTAFALSELSGNYVFDFTGFDGTQPNPNPESFVGDLTLNGTAGTTGGIFDDNDGGTLTSDATMAPGTISQDPSQVPGFSSFGRGIATIAGQNFVFYIVNSNQVRFLSTNNGMLSGDAVAQSNSISASPNGGFAFIIAGSSANGGLTRLVRFTVNSGVVSKILMDVNEAGVENPVNNATNGVITYDSTTGRGTLSFGSSNITSSFVFYLSSQNGGVIQDVSPASSMGFAKIVADGSVNLQSGSPFTSSNISGTYAMNWSGLVVAGGSFATEDEEDLLSQVSVTNLSLSGTSDIFQFTSTTLTPVTNLGTTGQITIAGDGTGDDGNRVTLNVTLSNQSAVHMVVYIVSPQFAFFANRDNNGTQRIVAGVLELQQ